jgi:hypothetical protein
VIRLTSRLPSASILIQTNAPAGTQNLIACGGNRPAYQTPGGTSSITVTATSGTEVQTAVITINVH